MLDVMIETGNVYVDRLIIALYYMFLFFFFGSIVGTAVITLFMYLFSRETFFPKNKKDNDAR